jgi:outer membrane protein assembly factor BamB
MTGPRLAPPTRPITRLVRGFCLAAAGLLVCAAAAYGAPPPIPQNPADFAGLDEFSGRVALKRPVRAPRVPRHPFMAEGSRSNVHNDAYQTDTYRNLGPLGRRTRIFSQSFDGMGGIGSCGITIAFDRRGRLITTCVSAISVQLRLLNPRTLDTIASHQLPDRVLAPGVSPFQDPGGAYFYLDQRDRAVISVGRQIFVVAFRNGQWRRDRTYDLSSVISPDDQLNSALPDWSGRLWFVTRRQGLVGVLDPRTGRVLGTHRTGEAVGNSFAVDDTGGVFVVTDRAQYRFDSGRRGAPRVSWRVRYDNVGIQKPGQFDAGSGTTPTVMGRRYLAITDNADPMQVVVMRRGKRLRQGQRRVVCEQPVFRKGASATENSIVATDRSMIVENNYGYFPPPNATSNGNTTTPGVERVDLRRDGKGCRKVWHSREISPSTVPKLSLASGLIYLYTKPRGTPDAWYVTAIDFHTGKTVWRRLIGTGLLFNVHYAGIAISPRSVLYTGVLGGTVALADG